MPLSKRAQLRAAEDRKARALIARYDARLSGLSGIARVAQASASLRDLGASERQAARDKTEPPVLAGTEGSSTFDRSGSQWSPQA